MANDHQVRAITERILLGPFLTQVRAELLLSQEVTHVLNVSEAPSLPQVRAAGFASVLDEPIVDLQPIPVAKMTRCVDFLNEALSEPNGRVYVHCIAGQNRSPTIVWLYLMSCGMDRTEAKQLIENSAPDAIPGHPALINDAVIAAACLDDYDRE